MGWFVQRQRPIITDEKPIPGTNNVSMGNLTISTRFQSHTLESLLYECVL